MGSFIVIENRGSYLFFNTEDKILGKIPTPSNLASSKSDNHLHFGTPGYNPQAEKFIKEITGLSVYDFAKAKVFNMKAYGVSEKVHTSISAQDHIQLLIQEGTKQSGVREIVNRYMINNGLKSYNNLAIFLDFANNEIFVSPVSISGRSAIVHAYTHRDREKELKDKAFKILDRALENSKNYDAEKRNAYIETVLSVRSPSFQKLYRKKLLEEFSCKCAICDINVKELLIASHIVAYTDCANNEERVDNNNGLLLCPIHDDLFDKGYISFDSTGKIILPNPRFIPNELFELMNIDKNTRIDSKYLNPKRIAYLKRHKKIY